ncbi:ricin-type beta-trefoil lectin domain protein [Streptomyces sp. NPDC001046]|uniref:ricin-type beta-trefoil lectin domain protein n=1 Tax=Streptomyces sp. NPDC001046 TaxID=3364543 RepID=UPI0036A278C9
MTRSAQQPPTAPGTLADTGTGSERSSGPEAVPAQEVTTPGAGTTTEAASGTVDEAASGTVEEAPESHEAARPEPSAAGSTPEVRAEPTSPATGADSAGRAEGEADPGAAAVAKSRLPALVRTMTQTAIDRPQQQPAAVGRPGKAVLAGAAVVGALLVSVPFLVLGGNDDGGGRKQAAGAGTVLGDDGQEAPGEFVAASPDNSPSDEPEKATGKPVKPSSGATATPSTRKDEGDDAPKEKAEAKDRPEAPAQGERNTREKSGGGEDRPAGAGAGVNLGSPVSLRSHLSGRCVDVPDGDFSDGKQLWVWDCNNSPAQKWQFASDGTVRIGGKCLDVAGADYNDGTPLQLAWCNGNAAQQFTLNASHDLVNTVVGKCADIKDNNRGNGAGLQLWTCAGTDNQKWSV